MTRGWFLAGFVASGGVTIGVATLVMYYLQWIGFYSEYSATAVGLTLIGFFAVLWILSFGTWRWLFRKRLARRMRPLWWANIPAGLAFITLINFAVIVALRIFADMTLIDIFPTADRFAIVSGLFGPCALGIVVALGLAVECLRPDRLQPADTAAVFD